MAQQRQQKRPKRPLQAEGTYLATIDAVEDTISKSSGNPMWVIEYVIHGPTQTTSVRDYIVKDTWRTKALAKALGDESKHFNPLKYIKARLMVTLTIEAHEKYGTSNKVEGYSAAEGQEAPSVKYAAVDEDEIPF